MAAMAQFQNSLSPSANVPPWIRERPPARMRILWDDPFYIPDSF